jgi:hypothetical protein
MAAAHQAAKEGIAHAEAAGGRANRDGVAKAVK